MGHLARLQRLHGRPDIFKVSMGYLLFISTILQSVRKENLAHYFPYDVKLRLLALSKFSAPTIAFLAFSLAKKLRL